MVRSDKYIDTSEQTLNLWNFQEFKLTGSLKIPRQYERVLPNVKKRKQTKVICINKGRVSISKRPNLQAGRFELVVSNITCVTIDHPQKRFHSQTNRWVLKAAKLG